VVKGSQQQACLDIYFRVACRLEAVEDRAEGVLSFRVGPKAAG
jgi:hypothetical protein